MDGSLWGAPIPILGVSGEVYSGKTVFLSTIDPRNTLMLDFEKSSATYNLPFKRRVDMYSHLGTRYPNGYGALEEFLLFKEVIEQSEPGEYNVIAVDPISDVEDGLVDWMLSRHKEYGFSTAEKFKATGGIFWKRVLSWWANFIGESSDRCQTFAFSTHLKGVWKGGKDTGRKVPEGKKSLWKMATLYLWLERAPNSKDKPPSAKVLKSRLSTFEEQDGQFRPYPILPDRLPEATPAAIRQYIADPFGQRRRVKSEEKVEPEKLSEDEKLLIQQQIAENEREAEVSRVQRLSLMSEAAKYRVDAGRSEKQPESRDAPGGTESAASPDPSAQAPPDLIEKINEQRRALGIGDVAWKDILQRRGVKAVDELTAEQAESLRQRLWSKLTQKEMATEK